jgi:hypothetical protein
MAIKLQYAFNENKEPVSITCETVQSGTGQIYHCPDPYCTEQVIPKKGEIRQHHFSHKSNSNCYGAETSLHLLAKEAILSMKTLRLPECSFYPHEYFSYYIKDMRKAEETLGFVLPETFYQEWDFNLIFAEYYQIGPTLPNLFNSTRINLANYSILIETYEGKIKPDLQLVSKEDPIRKLAIEVRVTHKVEAKKRELVEANNLALLEIDLSKFHQKNRYFSLEEVVQLIEENPYKMHWINISRKEELIRRKKPEVLALFYSTLKKVKGVYELLIKNRRFNDYSFLVNEGMNLPKNYWEGLDLDLDESTKRIVKNEALMKIFISKFKTDSFGDKNVSKLEEYQWGNGAGSPPYMD